MSTPDDDRPGDDDQATPPTSDRAIHPEIHRESADESTAIIRRMRRQLLSAVLVAAVSIATAAGSILGQGIAYRQMRAIELIAQRCGR